MTLTTPPTTSSAAVLSEIAGKLREPAAVVQPKRKRSAIAPVVRDDDPRLESEAEIARRAALERMAGWDALPPEIRMILSSAPRSPDPHIISTLGVMLRRGKTAAALATAMDWAGQKSA